MLKQVLIVIIITILKELFMTLYVLFDVGDIKMVSLGMSLNRSSLTVQPDVYSYFTILYTYMFIGPFYSSAVCVFANRSMCRESHALCIMIFAERLSMRQLILRRISEIVCMYVCMYPSRLGIQLFRALRTNVVSRAPV